MHVLARVTSSKEKTVKPLKSHRVVELGIGPTTGLAGMVLADFGAEVIKVDPPGGDPFAAMPAERMWSRGKTRITVDLSNAAQVADLRRLILETADGVMTTLRQTKRESIGLGSKQLRAERGDLCYGVVSGFGEKGPYADYPGYEGVVAAKSGRMMNFAGVADRRGPNYSALQVGTHATSQSLAAGMLGALDCRARTGNGLAFETSMLRGMMPYEMGVISMSQLYDKGLLPRPRVARNRAVSMPTLNYHPVRTKDGAWLQLGNLLPHLLDNFFHASGFKYVFEEEKYRGEPFRWDREVLEEFRDELLRHMQSRTLDEWMAHYVQDGGVVAHPYQTTQAAFSDPDVIDNGHVVERDGVTQLGLLANLTRTPGEVGPAADSARLESLFNRTPSAFVRGDGSVTRPLEGVTIVESATIIAAPLGAATLADLGARVIKLEPPAGDPFRSMMSSLGASKCNTGKESICLDLKSDEGQAVAQDLAKKADVWIHNYRMGVPEKLGIGYETLAAINPELVYLSANGYGPSGPGAKRPSTHPIPGAALGGVVWQIGGLPDTDTEMGIPELRETARKLLRANEVNPDPNTSMVIATAAILGLCARRSSGQGQKIFVDMFGANAYANWDDFLDYEGKPERPPVDRMGYGLGPLYRLYECYGSWVFLAVVSKREREIFAETMALDLDDPSLEETLAGIFKADTAERWEEQFASLGIGCVKADVGAPPDFFMQDEHVRAENLLVEAEHPVWGDYLRLGPMTAFDDGPFAGAEAAGGSTVALLREIGRSDEFIQDLLDRNIVRMA